MPERGVDLDVMRYNVLIHGLFRKRDFEKANEIWESFQNVNGAEKVYKEKVESGVSPDIVTYNAMLIRFCRNVVSYNTLLKGLFENGMVEEANFYLGTFA
ncbi:Pentatricopeptide repeat [Parasponia andersonii]|uniref:Pentatricopeptide repeat n=1 Tax=Parasponia andersonii TaxID=3476 RepID=A0A2P5AK22_PARAD|nr:Pentatricopeptide repeat [Parasponia andersonii]